MYGVETLQQIKRIEWLKQQKLTLEEIKEQLLQLGKVTSDEGMSDRFLSFRLHMQKLEREAKEILPIIEQLKPSQARNLLKSISPQTAACIEALLLLLGKGPLY